MACDLRVSGTNQKRRAFPLFQVPKSAGIDDMAPQSISFIGDQDSVDLSSTSMKLQQLFQPTTSRHSDVLVNRSEDTQLEASLGKLNISSGSRTYRIPSPTRPLITSKSFQVIVRSKGMHCKPVSNILIDAVSVF